MRKKSKNIAIIILAILLFVVALGGLFVYRIGWRANINVDGTANETLYVSDGMQWSDIKDSLLSKGLIDCEFDFDLALLLETYRKSPQCGFYRLEHDVSNRKFINTLAYGMSHTVPFELKMTRYTTWVARNLSRQLPLDSASLYKAFTNDSVLKKFGVTKESSLAMFVRFKVDMHWCATIDDVLEVIENQYNNFWNEDRLAKCTGLGMSPTEVTILASIVEEETNDSIDRRMVAGLYLNRLHRGMMLQADPTVRFAWGDFTMNRILNVHLSIDSPYNTYKVIGLPPGPIRVPSANSIDAVLNHIQHDYIFMCAKADFSGTHNYATTYAQHLKYAREYQKELDKRGIK